MKTFGDNAGRTWTLAVNVDAVKRVKSLLGINLLDVLDDRCQLLARLAGDDPLLLVDVLYVLCQPAAHEQQVGDVEFGRAMAGDAILHGAEALLSELADFFPGEEKRRALRTLLQKLRETERRLVGHAQQKVDALDPVSMAAELIASIWQLAGILGLNPGPFTLRELVAMADGRSREAWNHTSALLAMLANVHRDRKKRPLQPADFHPYARSRSKGPLPKAPVSLLKALFVDRPTPR